jgi:hypothetical protein
MAEGRDPDELRLIVEELTRVVQKHDVAAGGVAD